MPIRTLIEAIRVGLAEAMRLDPTVIVLGEDVGKKGGVFLATDGLWAEFGDDRVIDTPLTESMIVGASIGAALNGLRPVAEIQFADFIHPAFNQVVNEAELAELLGSPRRVRAFALQFDDLLPRVPFEVEILTVSGLKAYKRRG